METFADWQEENRKGVIYYLKDGRVQGHLICGIFGGRRDMDARHDHIAREV